MLYYEQAVPSPYQMRVSLLPGGKELSKPCWLRDHVKTVHMDELPFRCGVCVKRFRTVREGVCRRASWGVVFVLHLFSQEAYAP